MRRDEPPAPEGVRVRLLGIDADQAAPERRGFAVTDLAARERLEQVGRVFIGGYRAGLGERAIGALARRLDALEEETRGFAYEGAAMALALLDQIERWRRPRLGSFIRGPAAAHVYMAHVGAGWALARLGRGPRAIRRLDPLLRWLALDGYGFHQGYFAPARHLHEQRRPTRFSGYAARAFDQGLGRSAWFAAGADAAHVAALVGRFPAARRPDLWSGVGLAAAYAGPASRETLGGLLTWAAEAYDHLAQGVAFAAAARVRAANPASHTELACRVVLGRSSEDAEALTVTARLGLPDALADEPAYEVWRARLRRALADGWVPPQPRTGERR